MLIRGEESCCNGVSEDFPWHRGTPFLLFSMKRKKTTESLKNISLYSLLLYFLLLGVCFPESCNTVVSPSLFFWETTDHQCYREKNFESKHLQVRLLIVFPKSSPTLTLQDSYHKKSKKGLSAAFSANSPLRLPFFPR